jgi:hypothetical protein
MENKQNNNEYYRVSKQAHKEACARYYQKVKDNEEYKKKIAAAKKTYYERHKEQIKAKRRERYQEKKEALKLQKAKIEENKSI